MNISPEKIKNMSKDELDEIIRKYFTEEEWREIPELEKLRNRLMFVNFVSHPELAHLIPTPPFLEKAGSDFGIVIQGNSNKSRSKKTRKKRKPCAKKTDQKFQKVEELCIDNAEKVRRNPKRSTSSAITNYREEEVPDDDRYIFCDTCQKDVLDYCDTCGMLVVIKDVPVPQGTPDRARKTVPSIFEIRESTLHGLGVFVKLRLPQGIQLGPYQGTVTRVQNTNGYSWKLRNGKLVDAADETVSNWMRYVNCAPHVSAQNLVAFQYRGELYYRTARVIQEGEELLVYYGNSFAKELGIEPKKYFDPEIDLQQKKYYTCKYCHIGLSMQRFRDAHEKNCRFRKNLVYYTGETYTCRHCNIFLSSEEYRSQHEKWCRKRSDFKTSVNDAEKKENTRTFECQTCGYSTSVNYHYRRHIVIHDKEHAPKYCCFECDFTTIHKTGLNRHIRTHSQTGFVCQFCKKSFNEKRELDNHYIVKHRNQYDIWKDTITSKIHKCNMCSYITAKTSNYKNHLKTHGQTVEKDWYHCEVCGYKAIQKSVFTRHLRIHVDQLPYVCTLCSKRFNEKKQLDGHIITNHSDNQQLMGSLTNKLHHCTKCTYKTVRNTNIKKHMKICAKKSS